MDAGWEARVGGCFLSGERSDRMLDLSTGVVGFPGSTYAKSKREFARVSDRCNRTRAFTLPVRFQQKPLLDG